MQINQDIENLRINELDRIANDPALIFYFIKKN